MTLDPTCLAFLSVGGILGFFTGRLWADTVALPDWFPRWLARVLNLWRHRL